MPGYVERLLSFPRAPKGSVSVMVWGMACASAIDIFSEACVAGYILATREKTQKPVKIAVPAGKAVDEKTEL